MSSKHCQSLATNSQSTEERVQLFSFVAKAFFILLLEEEKCMHYVI